MRRRETCFLKEAPFPSAHTRKDQPKGAFFGAYCSFPKRSLYPFSAYKERDNNSRRRLEGPRAVCAMRLRDKKGAYKGQKEEKKANVSLLR